jgi:membrane protein implicated in regulation of membrane protease activity
MDTAVYLICLGVGVLFTVISSVMGHTFGGHDGDVVGSGGHAEAGADSSDGPGVSALSPTIIATFITAFGGLGVIFKQIPATQSTLMSAPLSVVGAFLVASGILTMLRALFKRTQSSSESKIATLAGMEATVLSNIPENGVGEIAYVQAGSRYTAPAREETGRAVPTGRSVKITRVTGTQFFVRQL